MQKAKKIWTHEGPNIKKYKKWTHEGPSTKEKNDEHMKAYVLKRKKKDSHVSK